MVELKGFPDRASAWRCGGLVLAALAAAPIFSGCAGAGRGTLAAGPISPTPVCADVSFPIYFAQNSDQITDPARQALSVAVTQVHNCHITYVSVIGLTDNVGAASDNLELSRRRAANVASALQSAGLPAPKFEVQGLGEVGATTAGGRPVPLRRRTDVVIHATARSG